jgi:hypothetical protein
MRPAISMVAADKRCRYRVLGDAGVSTKTLTTARSRVIASNVIAARKTGSVPRWVVGAIVLIGAGGITLLRRGHADEGQL